MYYVSSRSRYASYTSLEPALAFAKILATQDQCEVIVYKSVFRVTPPEPLVAAEPSEA